MAVEVIDKIKPKNGGSFPIVEGVDVEVSEGVRLPEALAAKADSGDLTTLGTTLQTQIDQIIIGASAEAVVAPEVIDARIDSNNKTYSTLKDRIDATENNAKDNISLLNGRLYNTDNLLINAYIVNGKYYAYGEEHSGASLSYAIIPMKSDKTYVLSATRFIAYSTGAPVGEYTRDGYEFSPDTNQNVYISFSNSTEWYVYEKGKDASKIGTYQHPYISDDIIAREAGNSDNVAISQKYVTDALNAKIGVLKINGTTIKNGTDLSPEITETGSGYYSASGVGGVISYNDNSNFTFFKLPIDGTGDYVCDRAFRFIFSTDANGDVVDYYNGGDRRYFKTSPTSVLLWVSYNSSTITTPLLIAKSDIPDDTTSIPTATIYVLPQNVENSDSDAIVKEIDELSEVKNNSNIFDSSQLVANKGYYNNTWYDYSFLSVFIINAEANKTYKFGCSLRFLASGTENIGDFIDAGFEYTPETDEVLYCSVSNSDAENWKAVILPDDIDLVNAYGMFTLNPDLIAQDTGNSKTKAMSQNAVTKLIGIKDKLYGKGFAQVTGNLSSGDSLTVAKTNVKKNNVYSFMAYITNFDKLLIGHGKNTYSGSWVELTNTKLIIHNYFSEDSETEFTHELTISDYIYMQIIVKNANKADIVIYSNQNSYTQNDVTWYGDGNGNTFVESAGSTLTDCVLTWSSADFRKSVWMFGDSYFGLTNSARWVKYMVDAGYGDNVLLNAYPGENTAVAIAALNNMIQYYGKPAFLVWCLGMNDGSDTDEDTPSSTWMTGVNRVLEVCEQYAITPIFATIPTVPNIYHEGKNKYVRESNYRYIDFAKAVGASGDGSWFDGMLNSDNVHPNAPGAIALYHRAIADCPEITFSNP